MVKNYFHIFNHIEYLILNLLDFCRVIFNIYFNNVLKQEEKEIMKTQQSYFGDLLEIKIMEDNENCERRDNILAEGEEGITSKKMKESISK